MPTDNITYTWKLTSLKKRNSGSLNGVVFQTYWTKTGTDANGNSGVFAGATPFEPEQIDPTNFTAFEDLTQEVVLGWIKAKVTGAYEEHVNSHILRQIEEKINAAEEVVDGKFPWDPPAPEPVAPVVPPTTPPTV